MKINWLQVITRAIILLPQIITHVEHTKSDLSGPDKKQAVKDTLSNFIGDAEGITGKELVNHSAVDSLIDSTVTAINSAHDLVKK